jgi:hypothetical protein
MRELAESEHGPVATNIATSNSLADLAGRIKAEHEAAGAAMKKGLQHGIAAGSLLIEAKDQVPRGQWLPWLKEHCAISERTAQAYMRVARSFGNLDESKAQRVADLSFRDALYSLSATSLILKDLPEATLDRALQVIEDRGHTETLHRAVRRVRVEDARERSLESRAMLPPPTGRRMRIARNPTQQQWLLAIGPDVTAATMKDREQRAREDERVVRIQEEHDDLVERAAALEAEAKALRDEAQSVNSNINAIVRQIVGPGKPLTETYDFQCDDAAVDAELAALSDEDRFDRLLAARGVAQGPIREINRGYWGDLTAVSSQPWQPGPGDWTKVGSAEWPEARREQARPPRRCRPPARVRSSSPKHSPAGRGAPRSHRT